jgi:hypothetical protein
VRRYLHSSAEHCLSNKLTETSTLDVPWIQHVDAELLTVAMQETTGSADKRDDSLQ